MYPSISPGVCKSALTEFHIRQNLCEAPWGFRKQGCTWVLSVDGVSGTDPWELAAAAELEGCFLCWEVTVAWVPTSSPGRPDSNRPGVPGSKLHVVDSASPTKMHLLPPQPSPTSLLPPFPIMALAYFLLPLWVSAPVPLYFMSPFSVRLTQTPQERAHVVVQSPSGSRQSTPMKQQAPQAAAQTRDGWLCVSWPFSCLIGASLPKKHVTSKMAVDSADALKTSSVAHPAQDWFPRLFCEL